MVTSRAGVTRQIAATTDPNDWLHILTLILGVKRRRNTLPSRSAEALQIFLTARVIGFQLPRHPIGVL